MLYFAIKVESLAYNPDIERADELRGDQPRMRDLIEEIARLDKISLFFLGTAAVNLIGTFIRG